MDAKSQSGGQTVSTWEWIRSFIRISRTGQVGPRDLASERKNGPRCDGHADGESVDREATSGYKLVDNPLGL